MTEEHSSPIKTPKQLVIVVLLAFIVPIAVAVLLSQLVTSGEQGTSENEGIVLSRIQPIGTVVIAEPGSVTATAAAPAAAAGAGAAMASAAPTKTAAAAPSAGPADGKKIYEATCVVCHGAGIAGAPKLGDKAAWAPRLKAGMDTVYGIALHGKGAMPPKGGNTTLSDADVKAAVDFMVAASK